MPLDFGAWLGSSGSVVQAQIPIRAQVQYARILDNPVEVRFLRNGVRLAPQLVRVELEDAFSNVNSEIGSATLKRGTLHGIHGHPELNDTDVAVWDTFVMEGVEYTIAFVYPPDSSGQIRADFEAV